TPAVNSAPAYNPAPAYTPQRTPSPYVSAAFPASGSGAAYPQTAPYQYPATNEQQTWPYAQTNDGPTSVLMGRGELLGGPQLAPPQLQLPVPAPSPQSPYNYDNYGPMQQSRPTLPMYQAPNYSMQPQMMPSYAMPGCTSPGYAMPGYAMPGYATQGYAMPGYANGSAGCDVWPNGYASMNGQPAVRNWFGSFGGLVMTRTRSSHHTFSYGTGNEADQRTDSRDADMDWAGGFDVRFGRYFNCQRNAIEAVYWGIFPASQSTQTVSANVLGNLNGILNWNSLDYAGNTADVYVNVAPGEDSVHRVTRDYAFQNLELNLWRFCGNCGGGACDCSRLRTSWLAGVRYFRFDERLLFASDANDTSISGENDELYYSIDIKNHLLGFQVGNEAQYCVTDRLTANLGTKLGIFGNQINHVSEIGGNLGTATINNGPFSGEEFWVSSSKKDVAFLGEVNLGLRYCFTRCWTGTIGYRAVAVTGVALPADQIYPDLRGINDVENIDSSRCLVLHGGYAGLGYNW
ncbi:MAG: BBP7 family outer membrane beta-barrel protein, partial [Planctomycetota bacterium]